MKKNIFFTLIISAFVFSVALSSCASKPQATPADVTDPQELVDGPYTEMGPDYSEPEEIPAPLEEDYDEDVVEILNEEEELSDDDFEITSVDTDSENAGSEPSDGAEDDSSTVSSSVSDEELHNDLFGDDEDESGTGEESVNPGGSDDMSGTGEEADHSDTSDDEEGEPEGLSGKVSALISKIKCKISAIYDKIKKSIINR